MRLRAALPQDQAHIRRMIIGACLNPLHLHWERFILAEDDAGDVLGCGQIKPHNDGTKELASIYVVPEARGRGVAGGIIERLLYEQSPPIWLTCRRELTGFYSHFGFREIRDPNNMPAYFRRVKKLMRILSLRKMEDPLSVMCWQGN